MQKRKLTVRTHDVLGEALPGARVSVAVVDARGRPAADVLAGGVRLAGKHEADTDSSGIAIIDVVPNVAGSQNTRTEVTITADRHQRARFVVQMPDADADLHELIEAVPATQDMHEKIITVIVGPGQDFAGMNAALAYLSRRRPAYKQPGAIYSQIGLTEDYVMAEQVAAIGVDLSGIRIVPTWWLNGGSAFETPIEREALTRNLYDEVGYSGTTRAAFFAGHGGRLPRIGQLFDMSDDGPADWRDGIVARGAGSAVELFTAVGLLPAGVKNAGERGAYITDAATAGLNNGTFDGGLKRCIAVFYGARATALNVRAGYSGGRNLYVRGGSLYAAGAIAPGAGDAGGYSTKGGQLDIPNADISGAGNFGVFFSDAGRVEATDADGSGAGDMGARGVSGGYANLDGADFSGAGNRGITLNRGAYANAQGAAAQVNPGTDSDQDLRVDNGSTLNARGAVGGTSQTPNQNTAAGIIYK